MSAGDEQLAAVAALGALPMPVGSEPQASEPKPRTMLDHGREALNARMAKDDLRLVLENVITYAASLEARVAELEAERHTTNEALDGLVRELRATSAAPVAGKRKDARACANCGSRPEQWCPDCAACQRGCYSGFKDNPCTHPNAGWPKSGPSAVRSADKLRALLAGQRESGGGQ